VTASEWMGKMGDWFVPITETGCWIWMRSMKPNGYGHIPGGYPHRVAYQALRGPIPEGLDIDHLCRVRCCVNPDHMEPVTRRENVLRGVGIPAINARKTHCPVGHLLSGNNLYARPDGGRDCKACRAATMRRARARETPDQYARRLEDMRQRRRRKTLKEA